MAAIVAAFVLLGAALLRQAAPGASARPADIVQRTPAPPPAVPPSAPLAPPARDIFSYVGDDDAEPTDALIPYGPTPLPAPPSLAEPAPAAADGPRLVGLLRQAGALKAALSVDGEVLVVREGDAAGRYTVLAIDEEDGVRLRDQAGATITLLPATR